MNLKDIFSKITNKTNEAGKDQAEFSRKLEAYQRDKAQGEADKAAALEAKDEQAYKAACRAIADAEAGIEFSSICLRESRQKKLATDAEDLEIRNGLSQAMNETYSNAMEEIEKALSSVVSVADGAVKQLAAIDTMLYAWDSQVMKKSEKRDITIEKRISLNSLINNANNRVKLIKGDL